jgi:hypothetical protein
MNFEDCTRKYSWKTVVVLYTFFSKLAKTIPVTGCGGSWSCETSRIAHFLGNRLTDGSEVVSLMCRPQFTPQKHFLVLIYVKGRVILRATVQLKGLVKSKKLNDLIGDRTHDLQACSIVPQRTILPCSPPIPCTNLK